MAVFNRIKMRAWSQAQRWALAALICGLGLLPVSLPLAMLPVAVYVGVCCLAPLFPHWSWYLPVVSRGTHPERGVALTIDDGPDPVATPALLKLLHRHGVTATFFLLGRRAARHPEMVDAIIAAGHTVGNHSYSHDATLMLRSATRLSADIEATQKILAGHGVRPLAFRPPVGITNPLLKSVLERLDLFAVNFSCRGYDLGNRRLKGLAAKILDRVQAGDILLLHDTAPPVTADLDLWLSEVDKLLTGLVGKGLTVTPLAELIGREVMVYLAPASSPAASSPAALRQQRGSEAK